MKIVKGLLIIATLTIGLAFIFGPTPVFVQCGNQSMGPDKQCYTFDKNNNVVNVQSYDELLRKQGYQPGEKTSVIGVEIAFPLFLLLTLAVLLFSLHRSTKRMLPGYIASALSVILALLVVIFNSFLAIVAVGIILVWLAIYPGWGNVPMSTKVTAD